MHRRPDGGGNLVDGLRGVDDDAALWLAPGDVAESVAHLGVELDAHAGVAIALDLAFEPRLDRQVEDQREIRPQTTLHNRFQPLDRVAPKTLRVPLIGHRRIREAVADNPRPPCQGRTNGVLEVLAARGEMQQGFGERLPPAGRAAHQQRADFFGTGSAPGFAGGDGGDAGGAECIDQPPRLRGLAAALATLEGDELRGSQATWSPERAVPIRGG